MKQHEARTRVWIAPFQTKLAIRFTLYWLVYQATLWNLFFVWRLLKEGEGDLLEQYGRFLAEFYPHILCCLLIVPFLVWDAVRFSHRVVGPIYRFQQTLKAIAAGQPVRPIKLREGDLLVDFQNDFNAMLFTLQRQGAVNMEIATGVRPGTAHIGEKPIEATQKAP